MADETIILKIEVEGAQASTKATQDLTKAIEQQGQSINALRAQNKQLTQERNAVDTSTDAGKAKLKELNAQLDQNNKTIKENVDSLTKQKIGIGNYSGALDKLVPGLGATVNGIQGMTKSSLAFIATPIGAVVGALGVALGALTAYFKGSEEGQNRLNKIMQIGGVVMEKFTDLVELAGKFLFENLGKGLSFVAGLFDKLATAVGINTQGIKDFFNEVDAEATKFANLEQQRAQQLRALTVQRGETERDVSKLIIEAQEAQGANKLKLVNEAIDLQKKLLDSELEYAKTIKEQADLEAERDKTTENLQAQAEAVANLAGVEANYFESIKKLNAQRIAAEKEVHDQIIASRIDEAQNQEIEAARAAASEREAQRANEDAIKQSDIKIGGEQKVFDATQKNFDAQIKANDKAYKATTDAEKQKTKIAQLEASNRLATISSYLNQAQALFKEDSFMYKALGIARATIDTYRAADLALASYPPPFGAIAAGVAIATGLANVAKIAQVGFAEGGFTGDGGKNEPAGIVHRGEYVVPAHIVQNPAYAGYISNLETARLKGFNDGGLVTNSATAQIDQTALIANAFKNMPPIYTSWIEGQKLGQSVSFKESLVTI